MSDAVYVVSAFRTAIGKGKKGAFASKRPDELLSCVLKYTVTKSGVNPSHIDDVVVGCAFPEAQQGQNVARVAVLLAGLPDSVPGVTINRWCSSGLNAISYAANTIRAGEADVMVAGGVESMSLIPMGGNDWSVSPDMLDTNSTAVYSMGITAEKVAQKWDVSRLSQDQFALESHKKAIHAIDNGYCKDEICPVTVSHKYAENDVIKNNLATLTVDEGPRYDTSIEMLAKLKPAFDTRGTVTAGNSSQVSDGAACLLLVSENYLKEHNLTPLAKFIGCQFAALSPEFMGIGPVEAIPKVLKKYNFTLSDIDWVELNEAFASQSLAVINDLSLNIDKVNPMGGAIALGHPLGATGAILSVKIIHALRRIKKNIGLVTMCIGLGMGAAGLFEIV